MIKKNNSKNILKKEKLCDLINERKIKIFVINYLPLKKRRDYLRGKIKKLGIGKFVEFIIQKPNEYKKQVSEYRPSKKKWNKMLQFVDGEKFKPLLESDINIMMNYLRIYKKISKERIPISLIFEDDVIMEEDFIDRLTKTIQCLPKKFDIAYTDAGMHLRLNKKIKNLKFFRYNGFLIRTTASHFVSLEGAKKLKKLIQPIMPIDLGMRYYEKENNLKVYWLNGYLTYQGSVYGNFYPTTMRAQKKSLNIIQKITQNTEPMRFEKNFIFQIKIFLLDYLLIIPYRTFRILTKQLKQSLKT